MKIFIVTLLVLSTSGFADLETQKKLVMGRWEPQKVNDLQAFISDYKDNHLLVLYCEKIKNDKCVAGSTYKFTYNSELDAFLSTPIPGVECTVSIGVVPAQPTVLTQIGR